MSTSPRAAPASPDAPAPRPDTTLGGILLICLAMSLFACSDAISKFLLRDLPAFEVVWMRWVGYLAFVVPSAVATAGRSLVSRAPAQQIVRALGLLGSSIFFILALRSLPLATATTIGFASPLFVTILSVPLLGEQVGIRRWAAVAVGLAGVLIVVRPGAGSVDAASALPLLGAACWAIGAVYTRKTGGLDRPMTAMAYTAIVGFVVLSVLVVPEWVRPEPVHLLLAVVMAVFATAAQLMIVLAYSRAPASLLAPFVYTQLVSSTALGFAVFGNVPDGWTGIGAAVIIASGLYTAHREQVRRRRERSA